MKVWIFVISLSLVCGCIGFGSEPENLMLDHGINCVGGSEGEGDLCYQQAALDSGNASLCLNISDRNIREYCQVKVLQNFNACKDINEPEQRAWCLKTGGIVSDELIE